MLIKINIVVLAICFTFFLFIATAPKYSQNALQTQIYCDGLE